MALTLLSEHYVLWSWVFILLALATGLYLTRSRWAPLLQNYLPDYAYHRLNPSFEADIEAGLRYTPSTRMYARPEAKGWWISSDSFSLAGNVADGDSRAGLDVAAKKEVLKIMKNRKINFDEARRVYMEQRFSKNGVAPDGRPTDPRAVFFS